MNVQTSAGDIARILDEHLADMKMRILQSLPEEPISAADQPGVQSSGTPVEMARGILRRRRIRARHFPAEWFQELGWEILLHLFVASQDRATLSGAALTDSIGGPASSINRWTKYLERAGFIRRQSSYDDRRVLLLELTSTGERALIDYLTEIATPSVADTSA